MKRFVRGIAGACLLSAAIVVTETFAAPQTSKADAIVPFTIRVQETALTDLKSRLARTRFPDQLTGVDWDYGTNTEYLKQLVAYWRTGFDWRAQERRLNQQPQFKTRIDGLDLHFVHWKSRQPNALPIVMIHGWPGSFFEFTKIANLLTDPVAHGGRPEDAFDVVAVSLPGFGFSDKPQTTGVGPEQMAALIAKLMARLGYTKYGVQGGDWGANIGRQIALNDASHVVGLHSNFCTAGAPPGTADPNAGVDPGQLERARAGQNAMRNELAYFQMQSTKPQTVANALNDSPAGLASWIVEKFRAWCDCDGDVERKFSKDDLLTNVTIYWVTQTISSSMRIYYENQRAAGGPPRRVDVPVACAVFPKEIVLSTRRWMELQNNLARWTEMPRGGHFAAMEQPDLLADDIRAFFHALR